MSATFQDVNVGDKLPAWSRKTGFMEPGRKADGFGKHCGNRLLGFLV